MKFQLEEYHHGVTEEELLEDLRNVASKLKKDSITHFEQNENGKYYSSTFVKRFGSWFKALEKAGLKKTMNMNSTEEDLFKNLEEVWIKLGRQPNYGEMTSPLSKYHRGTYERRFGTWRKALTKFIDYINNEEKTQKTEELLIKKPTQNKTNRAINLRLRFIVMKRDNFKCKNCGKSPATDQKVILHIDHVSPYSKGGETIVENLQTLCSECNLGKSNLTT